MGPNQCWHIFVPHGAEDLFGDAFWSSGASVLESFWRPGVVFGRFFRVLIFVCFLDAFQTPPVIVETQFGIPGKRDLGR